MATKAKKLEKVVNVTKSDIKVVENKIANEASVAKEVAKVETVQTKPVVEETVKKVADQVAEKKETVKTPAKKTTKAKTTVSKAAKEETKAPEFKVESILQYQNIEVSEEVLVEKVTNIWVNVLGKTKKSIKDIKLYIKPEEYSAYYVINGKESGRIDL